MDSNLGCKALGWSECVAQQESNPSADGLCEGAEGQDLPVERDPAPVLHGFGLPCRSLPSAVLLFAALLRLLSALGVVLGAARLAL